MYRGKLVRVLTEQKQVSLENARNELQLEQEQFDQLVKELEQEGFIKKEKNMLKLS